MRLRPWFPLLLLSLLCALLLLAACEVKTVNVRYEVSGTAATIGVTYRNATGAVEQRDVQGSWSYDFQAKQGALVTLRAANKTTVGTVRCRVLIDGVVFKEAESEGAWKFVDCSGLIPLPTPDPQKKAP
jgi:uncharacterized lipoprotein YajG